MLKFSVVVPVHEKYLPKLGRCLTAIKNAVAKDIELIVVRSGAEFAPANKKALKGTKYRLFSFVKNLSPSQARNFGAKHAKADWIVFIDSDCGVKKDFFKKLSARISARDVPDCFIGRVVSERSDIIWDHFEELEHYESLRKYLYHHRGRTFAKVCVGANMCIRKKAFEQSGGFDESLRSAEDREFGARLFTSGYRIEYLNDLVVTHQYHASLMRSIKRHLWHAEGNKLLYQRYPTVFRTPLQNRLGFMADALVKLLHRKEGITYLFFTIAVGIPYIIKFALARP